MSASSNRPVLRVLGHMAGILAGSMGAKLLSLVLIAVATRTVGMVAVGIVFFTQATADVMLRAADFGLQQVLTRRAARARTGLRTLQRACIARGLGLLGCTGLFAVPVVLWLPEQAVPIVGFFVAQGLFRMHELGRAVLFGHERFGLNAVLSVAARLVGVAIGAGGMLAGGGVWAWLLGTLASEVVQAVAVFWFVARGVRDTSSELEAPLLREGLPFWVIGVLRLVSLRVTTLIVTALLGFEATGFFGVATRVMDGGLLFVTALSMAVFPSLAREARRTITRRQAVVAGGLALAVMVLILGGAPLIVWAAISVPSPLLVNAVRVLAPAVGMTALVVPMDAWLRAKDRERSLIWVSAVEAVATLGAMAWLVPRYEVIGAALALVLSAAVRLLAISWAIRQATRDEAVAPHLLVRGQDADAVEQ